jgi:hypothetical protein
MRLERVGPSERNGASRDAPASPTPHSSGQIRRLGREASSFGAVVMRLGGATTATVRASLCPKEPPFNPPTSSYSYLGSLLALVKGWSDSANPAAFGASDVPLGGALSAGTSRARRHPAPEAPAGSSARGRQRGSDGPLRGIPFSERANVAWTSAPWRLLGPQHHGHSVRRWLRRRLRGSPPYT